MSHGQLAELRQEITANSVEILELLNRRAALALQVLAEKHRLGLPTFDSQREEQLITEIIAQNQGPLPDAMVTELFQLIIKTSREFQQQQRMNT